VKRIIASLFQIVAILSLSGISLAADQLPPIPPIPNKFSNIQIVKPDPSTPQAIADFIGEWEGVWKYVGAISQWQTYGKEVRRAKLIIYEASPAGNIKLLFGVGASPFQGGKGWRQYEAEISEDGENKCFSFFPPSGTMLKFRRQNELLLGRQRANYEIEMKRVQ
jgi:hypothetical protein